MLQNSLRPVRPSAARGFTLIELVVVIAILTVLAGLILPKLDVFKLKANKASAASNIAGVTRFVESYKVQKDVFPDNWDSLLDSTTQTTLFSQLDPQLIGPAASGIPGSPTKLTTTTIGTEDELRSLVRVGITSMLDHSAGGFPGNSATSAPRVLAIGATYATINAADSDGQAILAAFYPKTNGVVPANKKIAVFGFGPRNDATGQVVYTAPFYANTDQTKYYNRFLVAFEVDTGGSRARMLGSLGADADRIEEEIQDFYEN